MLRGGLNGWPHRLQSHHLRLSGLNTNEGDIGAENLKEVSRPDHAALTTVNHHEWNLGAFSPQWHNVGMKIAVASQKSGKRVGRRRFVRSQYLPRSRPSFNPPASVKVCGHPRAAA